VAPRVLHSSDVKTPRQAWGIFSRKRAPRMIGAAIALALAARIAIGDFSRRDAAAVAFIALVYPFGEWAIHVYLLHMRPFTVRGRRIDLASARSHREHHEQPQRMDLINFGPVEALAILLVAAPLAVGVGAALAALLPGPLPLGPLVTMLLTAYVLIGVYEWIHFLIHTAHRPRSRYYRSIWRNHRLHHFKNEHYWHGITNTVSDRVLGTNPDQREVERSRTARALHT
jgi:Fatty acid hydroxylase superfamily